MIYRVDFHVHSDATEGVSASLDELVRAARRAGLDAIAITDQDYCTPVPLELRGILLIPGCEVTTQGGQILGVFLEEPLNLVRLRQHGLPTADEAVLEIHRRGGLAILAQPFANQAANPALFPIRPDAVETFSARAAALNPAANKEALLWATNHQRPKIGGSDAHDSAEVGNAYTEIACRRLSRAFLKEALDLGCSRPVFVRGAAKATVHRRPSSRKKARPSPPAGTAAVGLVAYGLCKLGAIGRRLGKRKKKK